MSDLVNWSVGECNRLHGKKIHSIRQNCPQCGKDRWTCFWGINPQYKSEYNPGEYIQYTCVECGFVGPELPS